MLAYFGYAAKFFMSDYVSKKITTRMMIDRADELRVRHET